jgi:hypothetical protein
MAPVACHWTAASSCYPSGCNAPIHQHELGLRYLSFRVQCQFALGYDCMIYNDRQHILNMDIKLHWGIKSYIYHSNRSSQVRRTSHLSSPLHTSPPLFEAAIMLLRSLIISPGPEANTSVLPRTVLETNSGIKALRSGRAW